MPSLRFGALALVLASAGCSLINAPDDIIPGNGGSGGGTGGQGGGTGGGGGSVACTSDEDCTSLTSDCGTGKCGDDSVCVVDAFTADTPCGPATLASSCDQQDLCDGNGTCVTHNLVDGTFCEDCPAGPGNCALCSAGACADCTTRATSKSFRSPLAASGWQLTGGWAIYAETAPAVPPIDVPQCNDGFDNDNDGLFDFPNDPGCSSATDAFENDPPFTQCSDGVDNDGYNNSGDGFIDAADPDCEGPGDDTEDKQVPIVFDHPVLGTDGNRMHPYGKVQAVERETSSATSPPTLIPANLEFMSWNIDEGFNYDLKAVKLSTDGTSFTTIAICPQNQMTPYAFCTPVTDRAPDAWDFVSLPVPAEFVGVVGYVQFVYDSTDACCQFERGWFIDALNFATDCACASDGDCSFLSGSCSTGTCSADNECNPAPANEGSACTLSTTTAGCAEPTCDSNGVCASNFLPHEAESCESCGDDGFCELCLAGACEACPPTQNFRGADLSAWVFNGDWSGNQCLSANSVTANESPCFPSAASADQLDDPMLAPLLGNNGSRTGVFPYTAGASEIETATFVTGPTTIPAELTFNSWHQDRGGNETFNLRDKKTIRVSVDGGANWTTVVNCDGNTTTPFCLPWPAGTNRALDDWDAVAITVPAALVGQTGIFEFSYDTVDSGSGWERGWYLDDLNINRCDLFRPPWPVPAP